MFNRVTQKRKIYVNKPRFPYIEKNHWVILKGI